MSKGLHTIVQMERFVLLHYFYVSVHDRNVSTLHVGSVDTKVIVYKCNVYLCSRCNNS